ncbi:MAG: hypothetical protein WBA74_14035, partial [Cyclobacteriaceae bacterium]
MREVLRKEQGYEMELRNDSLLIVNGIIPEKVYYGIGSSTTRTHWKGQGINTSILVAELERRFGIYLKDAVSLSGPFEISFPLANFAEAKAFLEKQYGFYFSPSIVEVQFTEFSK